jgi:hypothetical protein
MNLNTQSIIVLNVVKKLIYLNFAVIVHQKKVLEKKLQINGMAQEEI